MPRYSVRTDPELPFIDELAIRIRASPDAALRALERTVHVAFSRCEVEVVGRLLGASGTPVRGHDTRWGPTIVGFRVVATDLLIHDTNGMGRSRQRPRPAGALALHTGRRCSSSVRVAVAGG
jgi:hypothetical protein